MIEVKCAYDELVAIEKIIPNPRNPNRHPKKQIKTLSKIISATGWRAPITVSKRSGFIVRGHGRLEAAVLLGCDVAPVDFQDYSTDAEEWADLVADNRIAELADLDDEATVKILEDIKAAEMDLEQAGFSIADFEKMIAEVKADDGEEPEVEFTRELLIHHNYVVFYFGNILDWQVVVEGLGLKQVKDLIPRKSQPTGIGRVVDGRVLLDLLK